MGRCGNTTALGPAVPAEEVRARWGLSASSRAPVAGRLGSAQPSLMPAGRPGHRPRPAPRDCPTPMGCWERIGGGDLHRQTLREVGGLVEALASPDRREEVMEQLLQFTGADHPGRAACVCALGRPRFFWLQAPFLQKGAPFVTGVRRGIQRARVNTRNEFGLLCVDFTPPQGGGGSGHFSPGNQLPGTCVLISQGGPMGGTGGLPVTGNRS